MSSSMMTRRIRRRHAVIRSLILRGGGDYEGGVGEDDECDDDDDDDDDAISDVRGCVSSGLTSTSSISSSTSGDGVAVGVMGGRVKGDPWEGEIRRTREYYAAASSTSSPSSSSVFPSSASHSSTESIHLVESSSAAESILLADDENAEDGRVLGYAPTAIVEAGDAGAGTDAMGDTGGDDGVETAASSSTSSLDGANVLVDDCASDDDIAKTKEGDYGDEEYEPSLEGIIVPRSEGDLVVVVDVDAVIPRTLEGDGPDATIIASGYDVHDGEVSIVHGSVADVTSSCQGEDGGDLAKVNVDDIENDDDHEDEEGPRGDGLRYDPEEGARIVANEDEIAAVDIYDIDEDDSIEVDNSGMNDAVTTVIKSIGDRDEIADDAEFSTDSVFDDNEELSVLRLVEEGLRRLERKNGVDPSVLYVITRAMHRVLVDDLGYSPDEVESMRPDVAVVLVAEGLERPKNIESLPPPFYRDAEPEAVTDEVPVDKSMRGSVSALTRGIHKYRKKALPIILASLGVGVSLMVVSDRGYLESPSVAVQTAHEFKSDDDTSQGDPRIAMSDDKDFDEDDDRTPISEPRPDDLDKTWLDKLISFVSKPFGA
jgi:hypothetical protein